MRGRFVGISENVGHNVTFIKLNASTNKIISRSAVTPAYGDKTTILRADLLNSPEVIKSFYEDSITSAVVTSTKDNELPSSSKCSIFILDLRDLVGISFLQNKKDRQRLSARIIKALD